MHMFDIVMANVFPDSPSIDKKLNYLKEKEPKDGQEN